MAAAIALSPLIEFSHLEVKYTAELRAQAKQFAVKVASREFPAIPHAKLLAAFELEWALWRRGSVQTSRKDFSLRDCWLVVGDLGFPLLSCAADFFCSCITSEASCVRSFSAQKFVHSAARFRLTLANLRNEMIIRANSQLQLQHPKFQPGTSQALTQDEAVLLEHVNRK